LACISNDPSFELDPALGKSINLDAFRPLVEAARQAGVRRFVYASSSSVYGVKSTPDVHEDLPLEPLTDYSRFKAECEGILAEYQSPTFTTITLRPATVCGYSPRLRLDVVVNILSCQAFFKGEITLFGGSQLRPNLHIEDMTDLYLHVLHLPDQSIAGRIYNAGTENLTVAEIAERVRGVMGNHVKVLAKPTTDLRSYHVSSRKLEQELGFKPRHTVQEAIADLRRAFERGLVPDALSDARYYNIKTMQALGLR
jgi:nucleoside-diphosphate-sugar epimerase